MSAWYLVIVICSTSCAEFIAPGAPFFDEESCRLNGDEILVDRTYDGFARIGYRCEFRPLEQ